MRQQTQSRTVPRRGLSRQESAEYLGISPSKFDELRNSGFIEPPRIIGSRKLWDIRELDMAFEALPREDTAPAGLTWDTA